MSTKIRRSYTETFQEEAVRLLRGLEQPVPHVAWDLGIAEHLLYRCRAEQQHAGGGQGETRQSARAEQAKLVRLRRDNADLTPERNFSQHAAAFFAKESR